jgi:hypothetical protein
MGSPSVLARWPVSGRPPNSGAGSTSWSDGSSELLGQLGSGPVVAGQLITSWSHHRRIRSEAAFAKLGGAAPIEASSGPSPGTD